MRINALCFLILSFVFLTISLAFTNNNVGKGNVQLALLQYRGGGDWYANKETSIPNLIEFCNRELKMNLNPEQAIVEAGSPEIFNYPFIHMTGHGNVQFSEQEAENLRTYLKSGGFLHIDDNYGMNPYVRPALKKIFPDKDLVELPFNHDIYKQRFPFASGLPKIHEHDGKNPQGFGIIIDGRVVCFYSYETDLGDGWEDFPVHRDPPEKHLQALQMGANLVMYAFTN
ncbi:MAG: DUF4159 domain-containing protein [Sphingobacteriales bacterium]|jgi:hypothetical protein|nr:DUF4159 domain-containing protein [Sphingobacteriales bacterium]MBK6889164.1 DUF4159 domain-containing protein [Sphingobacteriales bacterium]MBK7528331.1 DUF4159 domain-containing protein [Sphingobacteriales bacterium]MBK8680211.1 DUF4159 domain-containing protein [Sphingobacteriales bacterium]MBL0248104.1 DUF4159 domain-containing protein [Sphingobacteriales bacterium]